MPNRFVNTDSLSRKGSRKLSYDRLFKKNKDILQDMDLGDRIQALQHTFDCIEGNYKLFYIIEDYKDIISRLDI
jgi:hypothetical protein